MDYGFLTAHKIIPVVVLKKLEETVEKLSALERGGIKLAEITFRTACAEEAIALASCEMKNMMIGAGTVVNAEQCEKAINAGAKFIVSPGISYAVAEVCRAHDIPYIPGAVTPTEIMSAGDMGLKIIKFFPAGAYGGVKTMKALSAAFPDVKFVPTGGVDGDNLTEYLSQSFVVAVGGSWMMKDSNEETERQSRESVNKVKEIL